MSAPFAFVPAEPDTGLELPHLTWAPEWREPIEWFCRTVAAGEIPPPDKVPYGRLRKTYSSPVDIFDGLPGSCCHSVDLWALSRAFYEFYLPSTSPRGAAALTGMLVGGFRDEMLTFFAWLRAALVFWSGQELAAHMVPTGTSGDAEDGGEFPLHVDGWHSQQVFNVFNRTRQEGVTLLLPMDRAWEILRDVGFEDDTLERMRWELHNSVICGDFWDFNRWLWADNPLAKKASAELRAQCTTVLLAPGQGYLVTDRQWMHGRDDLRWTGWHESTWDHRLYRIGYNSVWDMRAAEAARFDWEGADTIEAGCPAA